MTLLIQHLLVLCSILSCFSGSKIISRNIPINHENENRLKSKGFRLRRSLLKYRGGSTLQYSNAGSKNQESVTTLVSSSFGSTFLDKKKKIILNKNDTIHDLKIQLSQKFPGSPPVPLQRLFFSTRLLSDHETIGNITQLSPVPILLDMISGTSVYNRSMSVTQAIDAYVSTIVHQTYIGTKMQEMHKTNLNDTGLMETSYYREVYKTVNNSIYERYKDDIADALEAEKEPETVTSDTSAWRGKNGENDKNPRTIALAKEFDLNARGIRHFIYYTVVLVIIASFGTQTANNARIIFSMIPVLWLSKLRQWRLLFKIILYLVLPVLPKLDFLIPLLSAPYQVIAEESQNWSTDEENKGSAVKREARNWSQKHKGQLNFWKKERSFDETENEDDETENDEDENEDDENEDDDENDDDYEDED